MKTTKDLSNYDIYECDKCQRSPIAVFVLLLLSKYIPTKKLLFYCRLDQQLLYIITRILNKLIQ